MKKFTENFMVRLPADGAACLRRIAEASSLEPSVYIRELVINHLQSNSRVTLSNSELLAPPFSLSPTPPIPIPTPAKVLRTNATQRKNGATSPAVFISGDFRITEHQDQTFADAFPWADRSLEYRKMVAWITANPSRKPRNCSRFAHNWLAKVQAPSGKSKSQINQENTYANAQRVLAKLDHRNSLFHEGELSKPAGVD